MKSFYSVCRYPFCDCPEDEGPSECMKSHAKKARKYGRNNSEETSYSPNFSEEVDTDRIEQILVGSFLTMALAVVYLVGAIFVLVHIFWRG